VEGEATIGSRFYPAGKDEPVILFFHGNGEIASDYDELAPLYLDRGIGLLVFDYRGYGKSTGSPTLTAMMRDSVVLFEAAVQWLMAQGYRGHLWVMGRSLGSAPALQVARREKRRLKGLIIESGFADTLGLLRRIGAPISSKAYVRFWSRFNLVAIQEVTLPTLILHGTEDWIIPASEGEALYAASPAPRKELVLIPRGGHNDLMWVGTDRYFGAIERFVKGAVDVGEG